MGAIVGAMLLGLLADVPPLLSYSLGGETRVVTPVKLTVAVLMMGFALFELLPRLPAPLLRPAIPPRGRCTHPEVEFVVGGKRVDMRPGELWALDTSYEHSVRNRSDQVRVHLVAEVVANDWVWSLLPKKGVAYYRHLAGFWTVACWVA